MARRNLGPTVAERDNLRTSEVKDASLRLAAATMAVGHADGFAALGVATALLLGLVARQLGMPGQSMLTTMLNTLAHTLSEDMVEYVGRPEVPNADPELYGLSALYRLYQTGDGWVFLAAPQDKEWPRLVAAMRPYRDLHGDERFVTAQARRINDAALADAIGAVLLERPARDWEHELTAVDVACVAVESGPTEAVLMEGADCLGRAMGIVVDVEHPTLGRHPRLVAPASLSRSAGVTGRAPLCGEDTDSVLGELGYRESDIADFRARRIIGGVTVR